MQVSSLWEALEFGQFSGGMKQMLTDARVLGLIFWDADYWMVSRGISLCDIGLDCLPKL